MKYFYAVRLSREKNDDKIIQAVPDGMFCYVIDQFSDHHRPALRRLLLEIKEGDELHVRSMAEFASLDFTIVRHDSRILKALHQIILILQQAKDKGFILRVQNDEYWNGENTKENLKNAYRVLGIFTDTHRALILRAQREAYEARKAKGLPIGRGMSDKVKRCLPDVLEDLKNSVNPKDIAKKYNIGRSTVYRIKERAVMSGNIPSD
ncbi:hypothetical protein ACOXBD_000167 [Escherichia coli]